MLNSKKQTKRRLPEELQWSDPIKEATIIALERIIDPAIGLMLDAGITVQEFCRLAREISVRSAADRIEKDSGRANNSRVAILTGLARSEVARILNLKQLPIRTRPVQHPARKVLAAWYNNPKFLKVNGDPLVLPIFGRRKTFEQLVATNSGGIPVRAMLDQLAQINAVEILDGQKVRVKSRVPIFKGMTSTALANVGERAGDLLSTLTSNTRTTANPLFEGTAFMSDIDINALPLVRRQLAEQGSAFIDGATSLLARSRVNLRRATKKSRQCRVGVTVYYFQDAAAEPDNLTANEGRRRNLQRRYSKQNRLPKSGA